MQVTVCQNQQKQDHQIIGSTQETTLKQKKLKANSKKFQQKLQIKSKQFDSLSTIKESSKNIDYIDVNLIGQQMEQYFNYNQQDIDLLFLNQCQDCECCQGFVENCEGDICKLLGQCFCLAQYEAENQSQNEQNNMIIEELQKEIIKDQSNIIELNQMDDI